MKLLVTALIICMFSLTSGLALDNQSRKPRSLSNVFGYITDVQINTTSNFKLDLMDGQDFIDWMNSLVKGITGIVGGPYMPTKEEEILIVECYFHRHWERMHLTDHSLEEEFCKRLSENKPNAVERRNSHRYDALLELWDSMKLVEKIKFGPYNLTDGEKLEIEDCHFFRSWQREIDTKHDLFCKRLSENRPNEIESLEKVAFEAYRYEWNYMTAVAAKDFAQTTVCVLVELKHIREPRDRPCKGYFELIHNGNTWRNIRRDQIHQCLLQFLKNKRTPRCTGVVKRYKEVFCQNNC